MPFAERPPSSGWECVPIPGEPPCFVWTWYKPPSAPQGLFLRLPPELFRQRRTAPLTLRFLAGLLDIDPRQVASCALYGAPYDPQQGAGAVWDYPLPEAAPGVDPTIGLFLNVAQVAMAPVAMPAVAMPPAAIAPAPVPRGPAADKFARMESDWGASQQIELQLAAAAKQLNGTMMRVNSLNRDLSIDEARAADQQDKREWHEARRWLRDAAVRLSRFLKDHHIGMTSAIGKRTSYESIYQQYVVPRRAFDGLDQAEREFEVYRKMLQTLLNNMTAANGAAVQDAERRAQMVLSRIGSKLRSSRAKRH